MINSLQRFKIWMDFIVLVLETLRLAADYDEEGEKDEEENNHGYQRLIDGINHMLKKPSSYIQLD